MMMMIMMMMMMIIMMIMTMMIKKCKFTIQIMDALFRSDQQSKERAETNFELNFAIKGEKSTKISGF
jgi:hypothetical protein